MPFVTDNIRILRWLAYGCFLLAFTETIMMLLLPWLLDDALAAVGVSVSSLLSINFSWLMMGALLLILGEVFERGHQLQQAQ
jgi:hypothetical protein